MPALNRQTFLVAAVLLITVSPALSTLAFILAALAAFVEGRDRLRLRERQVLLGAIVLLSLWFWQQKVLPERFGPGTVVFSDYVPFFFFFFAVSLVPFSDREIKNLLTAFLCTIPQQFLLALAERYGGWAGRYYFPARALPIIDIYVGPSEPRLAVSGSFFNPSILALYCLLGFIFSLTLLLGEAEKTGDRGRGFFKKPQTVLPGAGLLCSFILLLWTQSRNAWLFTMLVLLALARFRARRLLIGLGGIMLVLTLLAVFQLFFPTAVVEFLLPESLGAKLTVFSEDRARYYQLVWDLILIRPLTGWGIGTFPLLVPESVFGHQLLHTHSLPLQLALEVGLPAAAAVLGGLVYLIGSNGRRIIRLEKKNGVALPLDRGLLVAAAAILLMQVFDLTLLMTYRLQFLFWLCLAIPFSRREKLPTIHRPPAKPEA